MPAARVAAARTIRPLRTTEVIKEVQRAQLPQQINLEDAATPLAAGKLQCNVMGYASP